MFWYRFSAVVAMALLVCSVCALSEAGHDAKRALSNQEEEGYVFNIPLNEDTDPMSDGAKYLAEQHQDGLNAPPFNPNIYNQDSDDED